MCPRVHVVHQGHAFNLLHVRANEVDVYVVRRPFQSTLNTRMNRPQELQEDEQADEDADDGVDDVPLQGQDEDGGDDDADGAKEVAQDVLEGRPQR